MAQHTGQMDYWTNPNYDGMLWTASAVEGQGTGTPFLTIMGGLNGQNTKDVSDFDYSMSAEYDFPAASQPDISELASQTAPDAVSPILEQNRNTCQIFQEAVNITYKKESTTARKATDIVVGGVGYWADDGSDNQSDLVNAQILYSLQKIARDAEWSFLNGTYQQSTANNVAAKTRGVITACTTNATDAAGVGLNKNLTSALFADMADNTGGRAYMATPIIFVNSKQKTVLSDLYVYQEQNWEIGGANIQTIITDFGTVGVVYNPFIPADTLLFASMAMCKPVFCPTKMGRLFEEDLAKTGAATKKQIYGQMGIDYGNEKMHGKITNLAV